MNIGQTEFTCLWLIDNYSHCAHNNAEILSSPSFFADGIRGILFLHLYPRGFDNERKGWISLFLRRGVDRGPESLPLKFEIAILAADGSVLKANKYTFTFRIGKGYGNRKFVEMAEVLLRRKADYLPQDTLRVRCRILTGEGDIKDVRKIEVRTHVGTERISFLSAVEDFSTLEPNRRITLDIDCLSNEEVYMPSSLYLVDDCCEGKIIVELPYRFVSRCRISLLDASENLITCGEVDYRLDATRKDIQKLALSLSRQAILDRKAQYLKGDKLYLMCEYTFSIGIETNRIEGVLDSVPVMVSKQINDYEASQEMHNWAKKVSACPSALDDFKKLYNNRLFTDVVLKTNTNSLFAHKIVLCARSSVFYAMLTTDTKEKISGCIRIEHLENDIVQKMLLFLYSDELENLEWDTAIKLYQAADYYDIKKLKVMCASFLVGNLSTSTAIELLQLADARNDSDLKKAAEDFIIMHDDQVFSSDEFEVLKRTDAKLALQTIHLKYHRKF